MGTAEGVVAPSIEEVRSWFPHEDDREKFDRMIQATQRYAWQRGFNACEGYQEGLTFRPDNPFDDFGGSQ